MSAEERTPRTPTTTRTTTTKASRAKAVCLRPLKSLWSLLSLWSFLACVAVAAFIALTAVALVWHSDAKTTLPTFAETRDRYRTSEAVLLDRNGEILHELRTDSDGRRLAWVRLGDVSPALTAAVIHAEDRNFRLHHGVDWPSFVWGMASTALGGATRGASTITMQLAALLDPMLKPGSAVAAGGRGARAAHRSFRQKIIQIRRALRLEQTWSKEEILEAYMNLAGFRGELQGVSAASRGLLGKEPHGLDSDEAAILACLLRSPNAPARLVQARAELLLKELRGEDPSRAKLEEKIRRSLGGSYSIRPAAGLALHAAHRLLKPGAGGSTRVQSTIDKGLQVFAQEVLRSHLQHLRDANVEDGALLVLENRSGEVLAYVGNNGVRSSARYVDGTRALRQAGSILKPFLYALAFDRRVLTAASLLDDAPLDLAVGGGSTYRPRNYDEQFRGLVTARTALASSLNIPAVRTLELVGVEDFWSTLRRLRLRNLEESEFYGPSLALGTVDVCLEDIVNAYRSIANAGVLTAAHLTPDAAPSQEARVFSRESAFLVSDILSDRESRAATFGLENPLATRFWTAVKTGTSKDMRDNWCVGFSDSYTVGVWVGNFSGASMWNVSGVSGAAPIWLEIMNRLHRGRASQRPLPPPGMARQRTTLPEFGVDREEWFLRGTEPIIVEAIDERAGTRIVYPPAGSLLAVDPDIPDDSQMVLFEASSARENMRWVLNGKPLPEEGRIVRWALAPGKHRLVLQDSAKKELDAVEFEVRGGSVDPLDKQLPTGPKSGDVAPEW